MKEKLLTLTLLLILPMAVSRASVEINGIFYNLDYSNRTAAVTGNYSKKYSGIVTIPQTISYSNYSFSVSSIDNSAFYDCVNMTSISIPSSVTKIGNWAFQNCSGLTSVSIPNGVTIINMGVFKDCSALTSVSNLNNIVAIGESAFEGCSKLSSINIPSSVSSVGKNAFLNTAWYNSQADGLVYAGSVAYKYKGNMPSNTQISIRNGTKGIASSAFDGCKTLVSIEFPNSLTNIGDGAFRNCNISLLNFPSSLTTIGEESFEYCNRIQELILPEGVQSVGFSAFWNCNGLKSITIPKSLVKIDRNAFNACYNLQTITVASGNPIYDSRNNCNAIIETSSNMLLTGTINTIIPEGVKSIGDCAFTSNTMTSIMIPSTLQSLGNRPFSCSNMKTIVVDERNPYLNSNGDCNAIIETATNKVLYGCVNTVLPKNVTIIGKYAFYECWWQAYTIPEGITDIENYGFAYNRELISITFPSTLQKITGQVIFTGCSKLKTVTCLSQTPPVFQYGSSFPNNGNGMTLYVPKDTKEAYEAADAWKNFTNIIELDDQQLEAYAVLSSDQTTLSFYYDTKKSSREGTIFTANTFRTDDKDGWYASRKNIINVYFDDTFAAYDGITTTKSWFSEFNNLSKITGIGNLNTKNITDMRAMFIECSSLTSLDLKTFDTSKVTDMGFMFTGCKQLMNIDICNFNTEKVTDMGYMFYNCQKLTNLDVRSFNTSNVTNMENMFNCCIGLTSLDVSNFSTENVTNMSGMFSSCSNLTSLDVSNFNTSKVTNMRSMFSICSSLNSLDLSNFNTNNVTLMGSMFLRCKSLKDLNISSFNTENVELMNNIFQECSNLTTLNVNHFNTSKVTDMSSMFKLCPSLKDLDLRKFDTSNVTSMMDMFQSCTGLTDLDLSNFNTSKVTLMWNMFRSCSSLKTIYVGEGWTTTNVTNGTDMFYDCNNLVGGDGTNFNSNFIDSSKAYAGPGGYLTLKEQGEEDHDYDWSIGSGGDFADVNSAMSDSRVKDGDVLQVLNGTILNGTTYITKAVTIKGNGYEDKSDGHIYGIYIDCEGVTIKNLHNGYIYVRANNATIERCRTSSISGRENYESDDVTIRGCLVLGYVCSYYNNISYGWKISNNIIIATNYWGNALDYLEEATVDHNLIINYESDVYGLYAVGAVNNSSFTNNIFLRPAYSQGISDNAINSATKFEYNIISNSGSYSKWPTNITGYNNMAKLFECSGERTTDTYYKLVAGSPALDYANDGGDCGPWSGAFPYLINGKESTNPEPDPTQWKLDPTLTTAPERYEFATLDALVDYLLNNGKNLKESVMVNVEDETYTMDVIPDLSANNFNDVWEMLDYIRQHLSELKCLVEVLDCTMGDFNITINMEAPKMAIFQFYLQYSQTVEYIQKLMAAKAQEMLAQGMSQDEVNQRIAEWQAYLKEMAVEYQYVMRDLVSHIKTTNIVIRIDDKTIIDPFMDPTHWKLDPKLTTNPERYEFATLDALVSYLFSHWLEEDVTVNVADATYTMDVLPDLSANSYNDVEDMLSYLEMQLEVLEKEIYSLESYNITISMEAPQMAVFRFNIQYSQALQYIQTFMIAKATEMLAQGMSQEEVDTRRAAWDAYLASRIDKCNGLIQVLVSHIKTTNIIIFLDNTRINPDPDSIEPNDLLALKNIYNMLGGSSWTNKKWKINDYGAKKEDFPGVTFDDEGYVVEINLENNNLRGTINPTGWTWQLCLPRLTGLYLQKNNISGDLSPWLKGVNRGDRLKALNMSYNNLTEISDSIPSSITSLNLENQNREWYRPDGVYTDPLKIEAMSDMKPIRLYLSANQTVVMPSLFTYNHKSQTHSARPTIYIINAEGIDKYGYFKSSGEDTYSLAWKDNEYTEKQNAPCYVRFDNPYGSVYPAYLRYIEGDANMSGYTDVLDVQTTLNYVLNGGGVWQFNRSAANTYEDNLINVQDIVCMVNIVLNNEAVAEGIILNTSSSRRHLRRAADAMDAQGWLYTEKGRVMLTTVNEVGAIDLELKGVSTSQVSLLLNHSQYQMIGRNTEEGSRYVIFSPTGQPIPASEEVALLAVSSQTELIGAQAADMEAQELELAIGQPTGLEAIDNGQLTNDNAPIYNVAGQRLSKMQRGINITNGRKVLK